MFNFQGTSAKQIQTIAIKVLSAPRVKLGTPAMEILGFGHNTHRLFIDKDLNTKKIYIAAIENVTNEEGKVISGGRPVNKEGNFGHAGTNHLLGGQYSEWDIDVESAMEVDGVTYFELTESVNGADKRAELMALVAERAEATEENPAPLEAQAAARDKLFWGITIALGVVIFLAGTSLMIWGVDKLANG